MANKAQSEILSIMFEFGRLVRCRMRGTTNLTLPQLEVLHFVHESDSPAMRAVAAHLKVKAPTATALIDDMVLRDMITRLPHETDRRQVRITLTSRGKKLLNESIARRGKVLENLLARLSEEDREDFIRLIRSIVSLNR